MMLLLKLLYARLILSSLFNLNKLLQPVKKGTSRSYKLLVPMEKSRNDYRSRTLSFELGTHKIP